MRTRQSFSAALALLVLLLFFGILLNEHRSGKSSPKELPSETADAESKTLVTHDPQENPAEEDPYNPAVESPSASATSLARGKNNQLRFEQPSTEKRDNANPFASDLFRVRPGEPVGPLTLNEHTLSAIEAEYNAELAEQLDESGDGTFRIPLSRDRSVVVKIERVVTRSPVTRSFIGKVEGDPLSEVTMVFHDGAVSGSVAFFDKNEHYEFAMAGNGDVAIRQLDPSTYTATCGKPEAPPEADGSVENAGESLPDDPEALEYVEAPAEGGEEPGTPESSMAANTIDTVIGYGADSRTAEGGVAAMEARIIASVDRTNTTFLNSLIADTELVLLATVEDPEYDSPGMIPGSMGSPDELGRLDNTTDGFFDVITDLRDLLGADQAGLVVNTTQGGAAGVAYITGRSMIITRTYMSTTAYTFVHELGHNLGCYHAWGDGGGASSSVTEHRYGWRFVGNSSTQFRTVMAYDFGWTRLPRFADPDLLYDGIKTGATDGYNASADTSVDPRLVSGGYTGNAGAGYNGTNPSLGARNADYINANISTMVNRAVRASAVSGPEIRVRQSGVDLTSGASSFDFGPGTSGQSIRKTFVIHNEGDSNLTGLSASLTGTGAAQFNITSGSLPSSLATLSSEILTVEFSPGTLGLHNAALEITSNDSSEPVFAIPLSGTGMTALTGFSDDFDPAVDNSLWALLGASISATADGQNAGAGSTGNSLWFGGSGHRVATSMPINTTGGGNASFLVAKSDGTVTNWNAVENGEEMYLSYSTDGTVFYHLGGPFNSTTWEQQTIPLPAAAQTPATVFRFDQSRHSGSNFDNYAIDNLILGTPPVPTPDITIEYPVGTPLTDGVSSVEFGLPFSEREFTIRNDGDANLTKSGFSLNNLEFAVISSGSSIILPGGTTTFRVRFLPDGPGTRTTQLQVNTNDPDEGSFAITLTGTGEAFPTFLSDDFDPDRDSNVWSTIGLGITANDFANAPGAGPSGNQLWFGGANSSRYADTSRVDTTGGGEVSFYFAAGDNSTSNWDSLEPGEEMVLEYSLTGLTFTQMAGPFSNTTWTHYSIPIPPAAQSEGTYFRFRQLSNSGTGNDHFAIEDVSIGVDPSAPEITLEQPVGNSLTDGSASVDFGTLEVGQSASLEFTVGNTGDADLTGLGISITGAAAGDFQVTANPTAPVSPAGNTTFTVEFTPSSTGALAAELQLSSNDSDEDPFNVSLTGTGQSPIPFLSNLTLSAAPLTPAFETNTTSYGATVPFSTTSTTVTSTAVDPPTTIQVRINGGPWNPVTSGSPSPSLAIVGGLNVIEIELTAGDGLTTTSYSIDFTPGQQTISFPSPGPQPTSAGPVSLTASSSSGLPINYSLVSGNSIASLAGNTLTLTGGKGVVTIRASQAGNGNYDPSEDTYTSFRILDGLPFTKVAGKQATSFAIRSDGTLWGTGEGYSSAAIGIGARENRFSFSQIGSDTNWTDVSPGWRHAHAIKSDGTLWGWGQASGGRLYTLPSGYVLSPTQVGTETNWSRIFAGESHSLAIKTDGSLWGWGSNTYGEIGAAGAGQIGTDTDWETASAGWDFSVAIKAGGTLWTWGRNTYGQLGTGDTAHLAAPTQVGSDTDWESVSAGYYYILATKTDGSLWAWGRNISGMLGTGDTVDHFTPVRIGTDNDWEEVAAGSTNSYGRRSDNTLWSWGSNSLGGLGTGALFSDYTPTQIGSERDWASISANSASGHAIDADGIIWAWGNRIWGKTGHGVRKPMNVAASLGALDHLAIGRYHALGIRNDKTLWAWGRDINGILGDGSNASQPGPSQVGTSSNWESASASFYQSVGIRDNGTLWTWGDDRNGFLGLGNTGEIQSSPVQIGSGTNWESASAGWSYTLAIQSDRSLWGWGEGSLGQLGDGTYFDQTSPVRIGADNDWSQVSASYQHSAAIRDNGSLWTWGSNSSGRLGDGTTTSTGSPVQVGTDTDWSTVSAGYRHTAALKTDGSLWTWGYGGYGELGDGSTTTTQRSPLRVGSDNDWIDVRAGEYFTLALKSNGTLWIWGLNQQGAFASERPSQSLTPRQLSSYGGWSRLPDQTPGRFFNNFFAFATDGSLWGWGEPSYSMLTETIDDYTVPRPALPYVEQELTFPAITIPQPGQSVTLNASSNSGLPVQYGVSGPATISGNLLTVNAPGTVTVFAHQDGDSVWNATGPVSPGADANLTQLTLSDGTLTPLFQSGITDYNASVSSPTTSSITVNATTSDGNATVEVRSNGGSFVPFISGSPSPSLALVPDNNNIEVRVTAPDGTTTQTYRVTVFRPIPSIDASLTNLILDGHSLSPAFQSAIDGYSSFVPLSTTAATVTSTTSHPNATIEVRSNGGLFQPASSGVSSVPLSLNSGPNSIDVRVTAEDATTIQIYSIAVGVGTQEIDFPNINPVFTNAGPFSLNATSSSGLPVSFAITSGNASASLSGNTITLTGTPGPVTIQASQSGNGNYLPATNEFATFYVFPAGQGIAEICVSRHSNLILRTDGTLWSWGYNGPGSLGNGSHEDERYLARIGTDSDWDAISTGYYHTLALKTDGSLWVWGNNFDGQLGNGTNDLSNVPIPIAGSTLWTAVAAGDNFSLAVKNDGTLWAWGDNFYGQLGDGTTVDKNIPVQVGTDTDWSSISAGDRHVLALKTNGTLHSWGDNNYGQLGDGTTTDFLTPTQIGTATDWDFISAGWQHSLALKNHGSLWGWGNNSGGRLGTGSNSSSLSPVQIGSDTNWDSIAAGYSHSLGKKNDGTLWSWGENFNGQMGDTTGVDLLVPTQFGTDSDWSVIPTSMGTSLHSLASRNNGLLWTWGGVYSIQPWGKRYPAPVSEAFGPVAEVASGDEHTLAVLEDGSLWGWGKNTTSGAIGDDSLDERPSPVRIGGGQDWRSVAAGDRHSLALKTDGSLWVWGESGSGRLGLGSGFDKHTPVRLGTDNDWDRIEVGYGHSIALKTNGSLWGWGYNLGGAIGNGSTSSQYTPFQIGTDTNWTEISAGDRHTLAVKSDGTLWSWGEGQDGRLGLGTEDDHFVPQQMGTDADWLYVTAGHRNSLAIKTDGSLWGWGYNASGRLGDGTSDNRLAPVQIGTDNDWVEVQSTLRNTFAIKSDGSLWGWGDNVQGMLADNSSTDPLVPIQIGTSNIWKSLPRSGSSSMDYALAISRDGKLWGWGDNGQNLLADASVEIRLPRLVLPQPEQTILFPPVPVPAYNTPIPLSATTDSGLPVRYGVSGPATLDDGHLTVTGPGTVQLYAYQEGNEVWDSTHPLLASFHYSDISVEQPLNNVLTDNDGVLEFTQIVVGSFTTKTFTVRNLGDIPLTGISLSKSGAHTGDFVIASGPTSTSLTPGQAATFTIRFQPSAPGARSATIEVASSDLDEDPFEIAVSGLGTIPDITIEEPEGTSLTDGSSTTNFGPLQEGSNSTRTYTIRNDGTSRLNNLVVSISGTDATQFSRTAPLVPALDPGLSTTFTVTFHPSGSGIRNANLQVTSNDPDESPFDIALTGTSLAPEISIEQPDSNVLTDGSSSVDFGGVPLADSQVRTFRIRNLGTGILSGLATSKSGPQSGEFTVGNPGVTTLSPGGSTTFTVTFDPDAAGTRNAALHVTSNDTDEPTFDIGLVGTGLAPEVSIAQANSNRAEGSGGGTTSFTFTVSRAVYTGVATTVDYAVTPSGGTPASASDFSGGFDSGTLSFAIGEASQTVTLDVIADNFVEPNETFTVTLSNPSGGATLGTSSASGSIQNDDVLTISIDTVSPGDDEATEGGSNGTVTLTHNEPGRATPVVVRLTTASSTAVTDEFELTGSGADFSGATGTATIPGGQTNAAVAVAAFSEPLSEAEGDEDIIIQVLSDAAYNIGDPAFATVTIQQNGFVVTNVNDFDPIAAPTNGAGTLRQAVLNANALGGSPTIQFDPGSPPFDDAVGDTIALTEGELALQESVIIDGPGARILSISGGSSSRVFSIGSGAISVTLQDLTIRNGVASDGGGIYNGSSSPLNLISTSLENNTASVRGGGIFQAGPGNLLLSESTVSGNQGTDTGGIFLAGGSAIMKNSTISGNSALVTGGGGVTVTSGGNLNATNVTISANMSPAEGGGIFNSSGSVTIGNSILAANGGPPTSPDISGNTFTSEGHNLVGDSSGTSGAHGFAGAGDLVGSAGSPVLPRLRALADNGGSTDTHLPQGSSPAIEAGSDALATSNSVGNFDQRGIGFTRFFDRDGDGTATIDIGAVEAGLPALVINEVEADNEGNDNTEFVELYDGGAGTTSLDNVVLVLYDGSVDQSYLTIDLTGLSTDADGYLVIGNPGASGVGVTFPDGTLQSGDATGADAVALFLGNATGFPNGTPVGTTGLVDAVLLKDPGSSPDTGLEPLLLAGQPEIDDDSSDNEGGHSLQRFPNGSGGGRNTDTFIAMAPTPGAENLAPPSPSLPDFGPGSDTGVSDSDAITRVSRPTLLGTSTPGALLTFVSNLDGTIGTSPVPESGNWSFVPGADLSDGLHQIVAIADTHAQSGGSGESPIRNAEIDTLPPTVTLNQAPSQLDPASSGPVLFNAVFSESVTGSANTFSDPDVILSGTAAPTTVTVTEVAPNDGTAFEAEVSGLTGDGTVSASIGPGAVEDTAGNPGLASTSTDDTVTVVSELDPPTGITASDLTFSDRVRVTWNPVATAQEYEILRNIVNNVNSATVVGTSPTAGFDDFSASPTPQSYFYWVVAKKTVASVMRESSEGGPDAGTRTVDEHDDDPGNATDVTPGGGGTSNVSGTLEPGDSDFFTITMTEPRLISVFTTGAVDTRGTLRDAADVERHNPDADGDAGDALNFHIETGLEAGVYTVEVVSSGSEDAGSYTLHIEQGGLASVQPDARAGTTGATPVGDDVYTGAPGVRRTSKKGRTARGYLSIQNDGDIRDTFTLQAGKGTRYFRVSYTSPSGNITAGLVTGTHPAPALNPSDPEHLISVTVRPNKRKLRKISRKKGKKIVKWRRKSYTTVLTGTSGIDNSIRDSAAISVKAR